VLRWESVESLERGKRLSRGSAEMMDRLKMKGGMAVRVQRRSSRSTTAQIVPYVDNTVVPVALHPASDTPLPSESMAIGKAARWISFATHQAKCRVEDDVGRDRNCVR
jgi:hypothetical protein